MGTGLRGWWRGVAIGVVVVASVVAVVGEQEKAGVEEFVSAWRESPQTAARRC